MWEYILQILKTYAFHVMWMRASVELAFHQKLCFAMMP